MNKLVFSPCKNFPLLVAVILLLLGILACAGSAAPATSEQPGAAAPTAMLPVVNPTEIPETAPPAMPERRYLTLEFPPKIRAGDSDVVRLTLEVDDKGNIVPTAEIEGNVVKGQAIEIQSL